MAASTNRLISLDALRGFTIAAMIVANFPGSEQFVYFTLRHSQWNALSFTDLIAPVFLFIVGVSIALAYTRQLSEHRAKGVLYRKIVSRSLKLFAVGMLLNLMPNFDMATIRWTGTLHRIAIVFLVCGLLFLNTSWKQQIWIGAITLVAYWLVMTLIPTPDEGKIILEPGRNLAAWLDRKFLPGRMWQGTWDPEGILSTFPSIVTGITGMLAGRCMLSSAGSLEKVAYLMTIGLFAAITGYFWGLTFPVNENLWTSSFVLVTSGFAALLLGALYFLVDILGHTSGTKPGIILGANAITVYVLADVFALFFYRQKFNEHSLNEHVVHSLTAIGFPPELASLLYALFFVAINFIPAYILYRNKVFIKL
ncbi:acyltransferase family protein [Spirosoma sp. KNUC1025]|uniref:acyltransferase family protein n=1 Tax=Spirosoma sp. KNUC1025 TaxID=2894082 RepID=UPI00386666C1|nr:heparan-alpha-glucosaminide N-acetyltransferase domain-containing protein [Spirosoma sp. KNUC1025]